MTKIYPINKKCYWIMITINPQNSESGLLMIKIYNLFKINLKHLLRIGLLIIKLIIYLLKKGIIIIIIFAVGLRGLITYFSLLKILSLNKLN